MSNIDINNSNTAIANGKAMHSPSLLFDPARYRAELDGFDMTEEQRQELLQTLMRSALKQEKMREGRHARHQSKTGDCVLPCCQRAVATSHIARTANSPSPELAEEGNAVAIEATGNLDEWRGCWPGTDNVAVRFGLVVSFFFEGGATPEKRLAALAVVRDYCERFRDKVTHYQKLNASRLTRIKSFTFLDDYAARAASMSADKGIDYAVYGFEDGVETDDPVFWYVGGTAMGPFELAPADTSSLDIYLPASWLVAEGPERFIEIVTIWCNLLRPAHGTAGFGTLFNPGGSRQSVGIAAFPFLKRFPGLDYNDSITWSSARGSDTGRLIRTTNWLNIVCATYVEALGGCSALAGMLPSSCRVANIADGLLLIAGSQPELCGDDCGPSMKDYGAVAAALKPLRFEGFKRYGSLFQTVPDPLDPVAESLSWIRRFDSGVRCRRDADD